jgi:hypothetical protein
VWPASPARHHPLLPGDKLGSGKLGVEARLRRRKGLREGKRSGGESAEKTENETAGSKH